MSFDFCTRQTIAELIASQGGSIKTGPFGTALKASEYAAEGVPLISVREIGHGNFHIDAKTPRVDAATLARLPEYVLEEGDIVFARKGGIERCALVSKQQTGWFLGSDGIRLRPPKTCNARFLAYALQTSAVKEWLLQHSTGSTMASLNQATIGRLPIALPALHVQDAVADTLELFDDRITLLRETNATLEAIAQALFKSWFIDFDPVRAKMGGCVPEGMDEDTAALFPNGFEESELGAVPTGWQFRRLGDVSSYLSRGISPKYLEDGGVLVLNQKCIRDFSVDYSKGRRHDSSQRKIEGRQIATGDVLVNSTGVGTLGRVAQILSLPESAVIVDSHVTIIRPGPNLSWPYLGQFMMRKQSDIEAMGEGSTGQTELSRSKLAEISVLVPPEHILAAFDRLVIPIKQRISLNESEIRNMAKLRDALLPRLISGQLRIPGAEAKIDAIVA